MPYWPARVLWVCGQIASLLGAAIILGRVYGYDSRNRIPALVTLSTFASILCLVEGQITPFSLVGLAGFAWLTRARKDWWAGAVLFAVTAKPLTLYLFFVALGLWIVRARRFAILGGLMITMVAASVVAVGLRPAVFLDWIEFSTTFSPLTQGYTATLGTLLRSVLGHDRTGLAYVAAIPGLIWLLITWRRYGSTLDWRDELPMLSIVSLLTTPFAWAHDALLLVPAVVQMAMTRSEKRYWYVWIALNAFAVALYPSLRYDQALYVLYPASVLTIRNIDART
jgi:Glycosyltransferase family 87